VEVAVASAAENAAWLLQSKGIATVTPLAGGWALRVGRLLDKPDQMIALYDSGGFNPNTKWLLDFVTVQAIIRSSIDGYQAGYAKAQEVKDVLLGLEPQAMGPVSNPDMRDWWSGVTMLADIAFLSQDDTNRAMFSINFRILQEKKPSEFTNRRALDCTDGPIPPVPPVPENILTLGAQPLTLGNDYLTLGS
jgi:hypothetical protein